MPEVVEFRKADKQNPDLRAKKRGYARPLECKRNFGEKYIHISFFEYEKTYIAEAFITVAKGKEDV